MPVGQVVADISPAPIFLPESFANNFANNFARSS